MEQAKLSEHVSIVEVRELSRSYPNWPSLHQLVQEPGLLWERTVAAVDEQITVTLGSGDHELQLDPAFRKEIADMALRYCIPESQLSTALCPSPNIDLGEEKLSFEQLQLARASRFKAVLKSVMAPDQRPNFSSLRLGLIESCRQLSNTAAASLLRRLPPSVIALSSFDQLLFARRLLASRTFFWQNQNAIATRGALEDHAIYAQVSSSASGDQARTRACNPFPFLRDLLDVITVKLHKDIRILASQETLGAELVNSFPTLRNGLQLRAIGPKLASALVNDLVRRFGPELTGKHAETAKQWLVRSSGGTLKNLLHVFLKSEAWLANATFIYPAHAQVVDCCESLGEGYAALNAFALRAVHQCLEADIIPAVWRADVGPNFARAVQRSLAQGSADRTVAGRIRQILLLWAQVRCSSEGGGEECCGSAQALQIALGVLNGDRTAVTELLCSPLQPDRCLLLRCALDECDAIAELQISTMAAAVTGLGISEGSSFLASSAVRRGGGLQTLQHIYAFLLAELAEEVRDEVVALRVETAIAAAAIREAWRRQTLSPLTAVALATELRPRCGLAWEAMCLAVGALVLPADEFLDTVLAAARGSSVADVGAVRKHVNFFFDPDRAGRAAEPLRHLFLRSLVLRLDETGLHILAAGLRRTVGDWAAPFLVEFAECPMAGLCALPGFDSLLGFGELATAWPDVLQHVVAGASAGGAAPAWRGAVVAAVRDNALDFCRLSAAVWCFLLRLRAPASVLAVDAFCSESGLAAMYLPCSPDGPIEMMRRLLHQIGVTSVNRCLHCGYIYGIGNCGQPMEARPCPECGQTIGGNNHRFAGGNQGIPDGEDAVRGIADNWFFRGAAHAERELRPLEYRILSVLMLLPLAVFSPRAAVRRAQLRQHWDALRAVAGLGSDTEQQHFLLGLLARAMMQPGPSALTGLTLGHNPLQSTAERRVAEQAFAAALLQLLAGAAPSTLAAEVQTRIGAAEANKPLAALRDARIASMEPEEAARRFAPAILRPEPTAPLGSVDEAAKHILTLRAAVAAEPQRFPVLVRCLFNPDSTDANPALAAAIELVAIRRLIYLPVLARGFQLLHRIATQHAETGELELHGDEGGAGAALRVLEANGGADGESAREFRDAWDVCRFGQQVECQAVPDLGDLGVLGLSDMVVSASRGVEGLSRAETLLGGLVAAHNGGVRALLANEEFGGGRGGEPLGEGGLGAVALWCATEEGRLKGLLVPWEGARNWAESVLIPALLVGSCCRTEDAERLTRAWIMQQLAAPAMQLTLEGWPILPERRSSMVRVTAVGQAAAIPADVRATLDAWVLQHGLLRDRIVVSLELVQRVAALVQRDGRAASPEAQLSDLLRSLLHELSLTGAVLLASSAVPSPLKEMLQIRAGAPQLRARHLNALQVMSRRSLFTVEPERGIQQNERVLG